MYRVRNVVTHRAAPFEAGNRPQCRLPCPFFLSTRRFQNVRVLHETRGVQHVDHLRDELQLVIRHLQPEVERLNQLPAYLFAGVRGNVVERLQNSLSVPMINSS